MKKSQIIALGITIMLLAAASFILYRKKASKLAYGIAAVVAIGMFFLINFVTGKVSARKEIDKQEAKLIDGSTSGQQTGIEVDPETIPIRQDDEQQQIYHPSKHADGSQINGNSHTNLVGPVLKRVN